MPDNLEHIGKQCFSGSGLTKLQIPKTGVLADETAFDNCALKQNIVFHDGRFFPNTQ